MAKLKGSKHSSQAITNASFDEAYGIKKEGLYGWSGSAYIALKVDSQGRLDVGLGIGTPIASGTSGSVLFLDSSGNLAQDNTHFYYDSSAQQLSVGTNSPYKTSTLFIGATPTTTSDNYGTFGGYSWTPSGSSSALAAAFGFVSQLNGASNVTGQIKGVDGFVLHAGSGSLASALGAGYLVQNNSTGSITAAYGVSSTIQSNDASGSITLATAFNAGSPTTTGAITNVIGMWIHDQGGANASLAAAMYIEDTTQATTKYGILSLGGNHVWNAAQTNGDFTIMGATDATLFVADASANKVGFGTGAPVNKVDIAGAVAIGASYAGSITAPTNGIVSQGTVAIGTTDFTPLGAETTDFGVVRKKDGGTGGFYYRGVQTDVNQINLGNYNLISGSGVGTIAVSYVELIGTLNEVYAATAGGSASTAMKATSNYNFLHAVSQATYAYQYGNNTILQADQAHGTGIGENILMLTSGDDTTSVGTLVQIFNSGSAVSRITGAFAAIINVTGVSEASYGLSIDTTGNATINDPAVYQAGISMKWNIPGTDANNKKYGIFVSPTSNQSSKSYFGDYVGFGKELPATPIHAYEAKTLAASAADTYAGAVTLSPAYTGAFSVTRHNYFNIENIVLSGSAAVTDAALFRYDASAGTHKAVDSGTTKTTPGTVDAWEKRNVNGTLYYVPMYTSKTS